MAQQKTWGGRFTGETDNRVELFTESISFDQRLYPEDILASQAHARMLAHVGLLTSDEAELIVITLEDIKGEIERGEMEYSIKLEDIHTHIEQALIKRLGDIGRKLHTGRSRNDQVATDVRLWTRSAIDILDLRLTEMQRALLSNAERDRDLILPGYTHFQRAQPVLAGHYFLAYVEKYQRDRERLSDCRKRVNVLSLGTAALAGTSLPIDREFVRQQLGFDSVAANSLDVSSDRDFVMEFAFDLTQIALHLAGWAEEWILWSTTEFNFLNLPDAFCTGSSIMPHKKNPDVLELIRGKSARVAASLMQLVLLVKGLPLAYNRDLQEDKEALFDSFDTVSASLELAAALVRGTTFRREAIAKRIEDGHLDATTLMEFFVKQGIPLRSAHEAVGKLVRQCEEHGCRLAQLPAESFDAIQPGLSELVSKVLGVANALAAFQSYGSTAPTQVQAQVFAWKKRLSNARFVAYDSDRVRFGHTIGIVCHKSHQERTTMRIMALILAVCLAGSLSAGEPTKTIFAKESLGKVPAGWKSEMTGPPTTMASIWKVIADPTSPSKSGYVLAQTAESARLYFNLCIFENVKAKDVEISVSFKANKGEVDQGGGIVWRYQDAKNYYIARMNPLEDNYRLYKVVDGKRIQLASEGNIKIEPNTWHQLTIKHVGKKIECTLDGKKSLSAEDDAIAVAGRAGLWTKADAQTSFDLFVVRSLTEK